MDGFGDNFVPNGDSTAVDPAAEFLAREQDELAGLEDAPVIAADCNSSSLTFEDLAATDIPSTSFTSCDEALPEPEASASNAEEVPAADDAAAADLDSAGESLPGGGPPLIEQMSAAAPQRTPERVVTPVPRVDPEAIREWREEHQQKLVEKDASEEKAKDSLREKAKQELVDWYKQHDEQVAKTRQANRCAEKELVADTERPEPGTEWERIAKLCDFNPKTARSSRDVSRMRSIILHVKQSPPIKA